MIRVQNGVISHKIRPLDLDRVIERNMCKCLLQHEVAIDVIQQWWLQYLSEKVEKQILMCKNSIQQNVPTYIVCSENVNKKIGK